MSVSDPGPGPASGGFDTSGFDDRGFDTRLSAAERKRTGAWYTPEALVRHVVDRTLARSDLGPGQVVRVLDPACGDGRFLFEAARAIRARGATAVLTGVDIDLRALRAAAAVSESSADPVEMIEADALAFDWQGRTFDVVVGNPPFLSQMATATVRSGGSAFGGGPYADAAADFLALAVQLARPDGGRVGLVLPLSLLSARDAGPIRATVDTMAAMQWFWWAPDPVFDATVRTCAIGFERTAVSGPPHSAIERTVGLEFAVSPPVAPLATGAHEHHWGWLIADALGVPTLPEVHADGRLADRALVTANFRDQYYGMVGAVSDDADGPPLITTGLIDVGRCHWGHHPTRFAKQRFAAPRVDRTNLAPFMQRWAERCLVPKVLVATQSRVIEAVVDEAGEWLPAVPVIRVVPHDGGDPDAVWACAAVLTSPVASALLAGRSAGSGLSLTTIRVSQRTLGALAWPAGDLAPAVAALRAGDLAACGRAVDAAYGVTDDSLFGWWWQGVTHHSR